MSEKSRVNVVVRVRPPNVQDKIWVKVTDDTTINTVNVRNQQEALQYKFARTFGPSASQEEVYEKCVKSLITHTLCGKNASVFAYGPTGAGKTHTILGSEGIPGIIPRCVNDLIDTVTTQKQQAATNKEWSYTTAYSYLEIYNEKVQDLLEPGSIDLPIRENANKKIFVVGLKEHSFTTMEEFTQTFEPASRNRTTAVTKLNERSSRSHSVLILKVTKRQLISPFRLLNGKMYIIDLAGSEDNRRTGNKGVRLKESGAINTSLLALGQVVEALHKGQSCVPYRGSKLTRLLQDSLGGSAHSCMIVNLAPEERHCHDTQATLLFARKTKKVVNNVSVNEAFAFPRPNVPPPPTKRSSAAPANKLKRFHSDTSVQLKTSSPSLSDTSRSPPIQHTPPKQARLSGDGQAIMSPFLRSQAAFKEDIQARLDFLEAKLLDQMKENERLKQAACSPKRQKSPECDQQSRKTAGIKDLDACTPGVSDNNKTVTDTDNNSANTRLSSATPENNLTSNSSSNNKENKITKKRRLGSTLLNRLDNKKSKYTVYADGSIALSNTDNSSPDIIPPTPDFEKPALLRRRTRKLSKLTPKSCVVNEKLDTDTKTSDSGTADSSICKAKRLKLHSFNCTLSEEDEFVSTKTKQKRVSTACKTKEMSPSKSSTNNDSLASLSQEERNKAVLMTLSTGCVKDLQKLQTVGAKRAQLIYDWRQIHGSFQQLSDLTQVPGISHKYFLKFIKANFLVLDT